eukprot:174517_1
MTESISLYILVLNALIYTIYGDLPNGGAFILNECGKYDKYQQFQFLKEKNYYRVELKKYNNSCFDCNNCQSGSSPHFNRCSTNSKGQQWNMNISSNTLIQSYNSSQCLTFIGIVPWVIGKMNDCGTNNYYGQNFIFDSKTNYLKSNNNNSLCITAQYYPMPNCSISPYNTYKYCNQTLPTSIRVNDLISRMNYIEKLNLLHNGDPGVPQFGFPNIKYQECLHGVVVNCGAKGYYSNNSCPTSFPHAELLGATFNRSLWRYIATAISDEARALNNQGHSGINCWAPNINLCRDPRWGRCQETPGEDPFLTSQYVIEYSKYIQYGIDNKYLKAVSTAKHAYAYDQEGNYGVTRGKFDANITDQDQVNYYFVPFRAAVQNANIRASMCAYNGINGYPACGNDFYLNEISRNQWGFNGFYISDCGAIEDGMFTQYVDANLNGSNLERVAYAMRSGCDAECGTGFPDYGPYAYQQGILSEDTLNKVVSRVMSVSFDEGFMDDPSTVYYRQYGPEYIDNPQHRALSLSAAEQGIVLLKNKNNILPLKSDYSQTIAIIGPHGNATQRMLSSYHGGNNLVNSHSPLQIISKLAKSTSYIMGCSLICNNTSKFNDAVNAATKADISLVFLGLDPVNDESKCRVENSSSNGCCDNNGHCFTATETEGWDRGQIAFPGYQLELLQAIANVTSTKTILIMMNGGMIDLSWPKMDNSNVDAIIEAFYPGQLGGDAIANILYGKVSPGGKLPLTIYPVSMTKQRETGDMNLRNNGGITYQYYTGKVVYEFGYGLSYTTFEYVYYDSNVNKSVSTLEMANYYRNKLYYRDVISYTIGVKNTGHMDSDCVVLGFVNYTDPDAPIKSLFDFQRVFVKVNQIVNVSLSISPESISILIRKEMR